MRKVLEKIEHLTIKAKLEQFSGATTLSGKIGARWIQPVVL